MSLHKAKSDELDQQHFNLDLEMLTPPIACRYIQINGAFAKDAMNPSLGDERAIALPAPITARSHISKELSMSDRWNPTNIEE